MKTTNNNLSQLKTYQKSLIITFLVMALPFVQSSFAQSVYKIATSSSIKVLGTSNLHDWDMKASSFTCEGNFVVKNNQLQDIKTLSFTLPVTNLKSKESLMNTRAYKALNTEKYPSITFKLTDASVNPTQKTIKANGILTISGVSNTVTLNNTYTLNNDGSLAIKGARAIKMSDFKIKAPSFMFGALKTGNEVTIEYILNLKN